MKKRSPLVGSTGRSEIRSPFHAPPDEACRYAIDDASALDGSGIRHVDLPAADQYQLQAEAFSRAVRNEQPAASALDDAITNLRIIEALFAAGASGRFERPVPR